ncbi:MAG TPA: cobalamin biosynthesis protein [Candidatus Binataceae bacterium]|nr:cobalamin biosynthesis protein [Candidatus Binataceae bacterium]
MTTPRKPFAIFAITRHGLEIAARLKESFKDADVYVSEKLLPFALSKPRLANALGLKLPMGPRLGETFSGYDCHVFIVSIGAVVRMIAPLMRDKKTDPAVVCVDDAARFAVCVLSGHVGRGNVFTERIAAALGAQAVVTTASDAIGTLTVDILGRDFGWTLDDPERNVTRGCAAVVNAAPVLFIQETGEPDWWPLDKALPPGVRYATALDGVDPRAFEILLVATDRDFRETHLGHWDNAVIYRPRSLVVGIGCDRGTPAPLVERGVLAAFEANRLSLKSVGKLATIDKKRDEPAIVALAERFGWPLEIHSAEKLDAAPGIENPSDTVKRHVGARGVAEPAALIGAGAERLLVPKRIYTEPGAGRSMTVAVARIPFGKRPMEATDA